MLYLSALEVPGSLCGRGGFSQILFAFTNNIWTKPAPTIRQYVLRMSPDIISVKIVERCVSNAPYGWKALIILEIKLLASVLYLIVFDVRVPKIRLNRGHEHHLLKRLLNSALLRLFSGFVLL